MREPTRDLKGSAQGALDENARDVNVADQGDGERASVLGLTSIPATAEEILEDLVVSLGYAHTNAQGLTKEGARLAHERALALVEALRANPSPVVGGLEALARLDQRVEEEIARAHEYQAIRLDPVQFSGKITLTLGEAIAIRDAVARSEDPLVPCYHCGRMVDEHSRVDSDEEGV